MGMRTSTSSMRPIYTMPTAICTTILIFHTGRLILPTITPSLRMFTIDGSCKTTLIIEIGTCMVEMVDMYHAVAMVPMGKPQ